ncbi:YhgE/Pip domain-containing protein [Pengzhenrongella sp.]|jgi:putative membrane protein|uniref:YhgE/Pip domain-containing protein n=1 Tax=Pengzhenrongella sp. TaxID=2888820 RepID=UPI002F9291EF
MSALSLGWSELRRLTAGRLPKIAMIALALIPTLYGGLYLFANGDPYANLHAVPAAIVVQDTGAKQHGKAVNFGRDVAKSLERDGGFGWTETDEAHAQDGVRTGVYDAALIIRTDFSRDLTSAGNLKPKQASLTLVTNDANNYLARTIADQITAKVRATLATKVGTAAARDFLDGFVSIHASVAKATDGAAKVDDGAARLAAGSSALHDGAGTLAAGAATLADGTGKVATGARQVSDGAGALATGVGQLSDGAGSLATGTGQLSTGLNTLRDQTATMPADTARLAGGAKQVADGNRDVAAKGDLAAAAANTAVGNLDATRAQIAQDLSDAGLDDAQAKQVLDQLDTLRTPITDAATKVDGASTQLDTLAAGAQQVSDGTAKLAASAPKLTRGIGDAADGAAAASTGASDLAAGAAKAAGGADALATGAAKTSTGADQAAAGASTLSAGAAKLDARSGDLATGAATLASGASDLHTGLAHGRDKIPNPDATTVDGTAVTIGDPVGVHGDALSAAGSYGAGLAPFFLSLSAWIGAYVLFLLVKPLSQRALAAGRSSLRTALGGWFTPALIGVVQMAAMFTVVRLALGIEPVHPWFTALFLVLISAAFVAILQALNVWFGAVGQFLGLVLMLTQLVTAGGTFPWQTLPEPLSALHQFLPMSYAVQGLRQLLYGGNLGIAAGDAAVLAGFLLGALALTTWAARRRRVWTTTRLQPELVL